MAVRAAVARRAGRGVRCARAAAAVLLTGATLATAPAALADGTGGTSGGTSGADGLGAVPSWPPHGSAVHGSPGTTGAPRLAPGHVYRDAIQPGETRHYAVRLDATSWDYLSAFALPATGAKVTFDDGLHLVLTRSGGYQCGEVQLNFPDRDAAHPVGDYLTRSPTGPCGRAGTFDLAVTRTTGGDHHSWRLELLDTREPGLSADALSPAPLASARPTGSPSVPGGDATRPAHGATSLDDAAPVGDGVWSDRLRPGQALFYAVHVGWGQRLAVRADFGAWQGTAVVPFVVDGIRVELYNPARGYVTSGAESYHGDAASAGLQTVPVAWGNRTVPLDGLNQARLAGDYVVEVSLSPDLASAIHDPLPFTLRVAVTGHRQAAPPYAGGSKAAVPGSGDSGTNGTSGASGTSGSGADAGTNGGKGDGTTASAGSGRAAAGLSSRRLSGIAALALGGALVLWMAGWTAVARRRA
jgi:hypothetical protein